MSEDQMLEMLGKIRDMRLRKIKMDYEGREWDQKDTDRLKAMFMNSYGITSMALLLDRTEEEIIERAKKIGIYRYHESVNESGENDDE